MIDDVLGLPDQLGDALWRVETARLQAEESAGLVIGAVGASASGGDLADAALDDRVTGPLVPLHGAPLPAWVTPEWTVLCQSFSGESEETLACFEAAGALGARRIVASTGGALVDAARADGVPVVGLPGILGPRTAIAYTFTVAAEVMALAGVAPRINSEIEAAATFLGGQLETLKFQAAEVAGLLAGTTPVIYGAGLTGPAAWRWKGQINENAELPAFCAELRDAAYSERAAWNPTAAEHRLSAVLLEDRDQDASLARRFSQVAELVDAAGAKAVRIETAGETRTERILWATMLGDLVSLDLAR